MDDLKKITELTDAEIDQVYGGGKFWKWLQRQARRLLKKEVVKGLTKIVGPLPVLIVGTAITAAGINYDRKKEDNGGGTALDTGDPRDFHAH